MKKRTVIALAGGLAAGYLAGRCGVRLVVDPSPAHNGQADTGASAVPPAPDRKEDAMRPKFLNTRRRLTAAATTGIVLVGSLAFAAWMTDGTGPFGGRVGANQALVVTAIYPTQGILPGGDGNLAAHVENPNSTPVNIQTVDLAGPFVLDNGGPCDLTHISLKTSSVPVSPNVQVPGGGGVDLTLPNAIHADTGLASSCQGATFHLTSGTVHASS